MQLKQPKTNREEFLLVGEKRNKKSCYLIKGKVYKNNNSKQILTTVAQILVRIWLHKIEITNKVSIFLNNFILNYNQNLSTKKKTTTKYKK